MARNWEQWLATASKPASSTEEDERDRTESRIRAAIVGSDIPYQHVSVYAKGSYANGTNVRRDADVDVAVEWGETFKVGTWGDTKGLSADELGYTSATPRYGTAEFRTLVEHALRDAFGTAVDTSPDKCIGVAAGSSTLDADVVPCFALHRYDAPYRYVVGHRIFPKSGSSPVDNYPRQCYDNGVEKNRATDRRYKAMVRCLKRLITELFEAGEIPRDYPGYLTESLVFNVPNQYFGHDLLRDDLESLLAYLYKGLGQSDVLESWTEPSRLIMLFRGQANRSPSNARAIVGTALVYDP